MKILDIPQSGKRGITVSQGGRFGQISRALVIPTNPRTAHQMLVPNHLSGIAAAWRGLTQEQRNAWTEAAKQVASASRLGKSGALTGSQLYVKINMSLVTIGEAVVTDPPVKPDMGIPPVTGLNITNTGGVVILKLTTTDAPAEGTMLRAGPAISQGYNRPPNLRFCGKQLPKFVRLCWQNWPRDYLVCNLVVNPFGPTCGSFSRNRPVARPARGSGIHQLCPSCLPRLWGSQGSLGCLPSGLRPLAGYFKGGCGEPSPSSP